MGVTILVSSGDDGVSNFHARYFGKGYCGYYPSFPASNPYVLAIGGTQGPESASTEVSAVCFGARITSGGGFSGYYPAPSFQTSAISNYFATATIPVSGYNIAGRGYPDISLAASSYIVEIGGHMYGVSGTSCSSPSFAAFVSLINAQRKRKQWGPLGFINKVIWQNASSFARDVLSGNNKCTATCTICCAHGFYSAVGWDPVTGFGSVDFEKLSTLFLTMSNDPPNGPNFPTLNPTIKLIPTVSPDANKTNQVVGTVIGILVILGGAT
jgi:tripeptidyl-peptidase-1